jgi:hypothetical protein
MITVTDADKAEAVFVLSVQWFEDGPGYWLLHGRVAQAIANARESGERAGATKENEECAHIALERLNHWRDNCDDNIKAGCVPPQYNMGGRSEAATILQRIVARRSP